MMRSPSYCRAGSAVKRIMTLYPVLVNVLFPAKGWMETINIFDHEAFTLSTFTKALNSLCDQNQAWEENAMMYRIRHNKKLIVVERGVDGKSKRNHVNFYYIDRVDCDHVVTGVIPTDTESYQMAYDTYKELVPRKKKKRKVVAPNAWKVVASITKEKKATSSVNSSSANCFMKVLKIVYTEECDDDDEEPEDIPPAPPTRQITFTNTTNNR